MTAGLFPGQGVSAAAVLDALPRKGELLATANDVLGYDLRRKVEIAARRKGATLPTLVAQPAILVAGVVAWQAARDEGRAWTCYAGHSLGEYTALVAGGALRYEDALAAVKVRAEAMESAGKGGGGMAAVLGLGLEAVAEIAARAGVSVANDNAPGQVVVAGSEQGLAEAGALVRAAGARSVLLQVSGPFHTEAMAPAAPRLAAALEAIEVATPAVPVLSNVTARPHTTPSEIRRLLVLQLTHRVRFRESLEWLWSDAVREVEDFGPGDIVAGLAQRTFRYLEDTEVPAHA
jgi:[acyl-carrier-protein] S-malonyltransferase